MLIILEGCDGVGKTTLARRLAEATGTAWAEHDDYAAVPDPDGPPTQILHRGPPQAHPLIEYARSLDGLDLHGRHVIADRWHWGEPIYGELYRGASLLGGEDGPGMRWLHLYLQSRGAMQVHVTCPLLTLERRLADRGEDYLKPEDVVRVHRRYGRLAGHYGDVTVNLHDEADVDVIVRWILDHAAEHADEVADAPTDRWLGNPRPRVLLVGDETSPRHLRGDREMFRAPFVPYQDSSGWFLFGALPADAWRWMAVCNSAEVDVKALWDWLGRPNVVALGGEAARRLELTHARVPHPQWARRFKHGERDAYGKLIVKVAGTRREVTSW